MLFVIVLFFNENFSLPFLNNRINDQYLGKYEDFDLSIPSNTFFNDGNSTIYVSLDSNEWITTSYNTLQLESDYFFVDARAIFCEDDFCYVLGSNSIFIYDVSDITNFVVVGRWTSNRISYFIKDGDYLYLSIDGDDDVEIVDVKNKDEPVLVATLEDISTIKNPGVLFVDGDLLYVCNYSPDDGFWLKIFDISDEPNPVLVGVSDIEVFVLVVRDGFAYCGINEGIVILNVTDPTNPIKLGMAGSERIEKLFLEDDVVYTCSRDGLKIYNVSNITSKPILIGENIMVDSPQDFKKLGDTIFVSEYYLGLYIFDVSDLTLPTYVRLYSYESFYISPQGLFIDHELNRLFVAADNDGVVVVNVTNRENPDNTPISRTTRHTGQTSYAMKFVSVETVGDLLFVACYHSGVLVFDISEVNNPVLVGSYAYYRIGTEDIFLHEEGENLYLFVQGSVFEILRLKFNDRGNFITFDEIYSYSISLSEVFHMYTEGYYTYLLGRDGELVVLDISDMSSDPEIVGEVSLPSVTYPSCFIVQESIGYICSLSLHLIYNMTNKSDPVMISSLEKEMRGFFVQGEYGYGISYDGMKIVDLNDINDVKVIGSLDTGNSNDIQVVGNFAFVSSTTVVSIVDVSNKENPKIHFSLTVQLQSTSILVKDNYIFIGGNGGILVYHLDLVAVGSEDFPYFCGDTKIQVCARDETGEISQSFNIHRDDYCNGRGKCLPDYMCSCYNGYQGDNCESWQCGGYDFKMSRDSCSGHGSCEKPEKCKCNSGYVGKKCDQNILYATVMAPILTISSIIFGILLILLCYFTCFLCCFGFMILVFLLCGLFRIVFKQKKGIKKFSKLKNFDLLLKEQEIDGDSSIGHLRINQNLFKIDLDEIRLLEILGEGGSNSTVYKASWNDQIIAFKMFKTRTVCSSQDTFNEFEKEVKILGSVSHPNILRFFGCSLKHPRVGILMEYCENGDLSKYLTNKRRKSSDNNGLGFGERLRICLEIILPMQYLHARNIIHRDLKLDNVLIDNTFSCKLMDFGLSKMVDRMSQVKTKKVGTSYYMSPELLTGRYDEKVDVFAFGICAYIIFTENFHPYGTDVHNIEFRVASNPDHRPDLSKLEDCVPKEHIDWLSDAMKRSWTHDPSARTSFSDLAGPFREGLKEVGVVLDEEKKEEEGINHSEPNDVSVFSSLEDKKNDDDDEIMEERIMLLEKRNEESVKRLTSERDEKVLRNQKVRNEIQELKDIVKNLKEKME